MVDAPCQCPNEADGVEEPNASIIDVEAVEIVREEHELLKFIMNPAVELALVLYMVEVPAESPGGAEPNVVGIEEPAR